MRQNRTVLSGALCASLPLATLVALVALVTVPRPASSAPAGPQVGHPLVAVHGPHARLADDLGRQVLLRGVNDNQLGEYYVDDPSNPSTIPLTAGDFERMAGFGFDVVRLIVSWSKLEPQPGVIDAGYIAAIEQAIEWARAADVYVIVDMHQDAWGPSIATPPGTTCTPPLSGNVGWDGAPAWATITDGASTCKLQVREIAPAVARAFTSFYGDRVAPDGVGIQTHLVRAWAALAAAVADDPAVAGYDLLNEPNPGELLGVAEVVALGAFYERAITAIRNAELSAPDGLAHPVLFEPVVYWSLLAVAPTPVPSFTSDENIVFAPHLYAGSITLDATLGQPNLITIEQGFENAAAVAATYGAPLFSGEWGWFGDPVTQAGQVAEYARQEDAHVASGAWWQWKQACGDPHQVGTPGSPPGAVSPSLIRYGCPGDVELGAPAALATILSRSYPRAAPGRLTSLTSDPASAHVHLTGEAGETAGQAIDLWMPDRGAGVPAISGTNIGSPAVRIVPGGFRIEVPATGRYELDATLVPPADSASADTNAGAVGGGTLPTTGGSTVLGIALTLGFLALVGRRVTARGTR